MQRYFFDLNERGDVTTDEEGRLLPDAAAAHRHAVVEAREIMSGDIRRGVLSLEYAIEVRDETGAIILNVLFHEAAMPGTRTLFRT
jgi:hypothetical protein